MRNLFATVTVALLIALPAVLILVIGSGCRDGVSC